jgi:TRAP-type C4-dicarboxylate transport system substrate-binding protein
MSSSRHHIFLGVLWLGIAVLLPFPAQAQQEIKLTVSAGHAPVFLWVKHLKETFIPAVNKELAKSNLYKITWNEAYGGTLAKLGSELETIEQGVSDMGIVGTVFHPAKMPLQNVTYVTPFGPTDPRVIVKAMNGLHQKMPAMAKSWERYNQVYLTGFALDDYGVVTSFPLNKVEDLNGKKLAGPPPALAWIKGSGAVGVVGNLPSYYNDIKSGVYAGAITFGSGAAPAKLYEVAPNYVQTGFGAMYAGGISVNKARWDKFPPEVKAALKAGADEYASAYSKEQFVRLVSALDTYRANKGQVVAFPDAERARLAKLIENPTKAWIVQAEKAKFPARDVLKAYMNAIRAEGGKFARDWDKE